MGNKIIIDNEQEFIEFAKNHTIKETIERFGLSRSVVKRVSNDLGIQFRRPGYFDLELSERQQSIFIGSMLGDGHVSKPKCGNSYFTKGQCLAHREYAEWHAQEFGDISRKMEYYSHYVENKEYKATRFSTRAHPFFTDMRKLWYPNDKKIIPRNLTLDPLSLAIWYFDDGSNRVKKRMSSLATYCFTETELKFLCDILKRDLDIDAYYTKNKVIHIRPSNSYKFIEMVKPYMLWDCFKHKLLYREPKQIFITAKNRENVISLFKGGKSYREICESTGETYPCVTQTIYNYLPKNYIPVNNTSGYKCIFWESSRNKWRVSVQVNKKRYLKRFTELNDAIEAAKQLHDQSLSGTSQ